MNIEQEIRAQIEKNKGLKLAVGEINNHLSILEGLLRNERDDVQKQVEEAYQRGLEEGKKAFDLLESERNSEYQRGLNAAWEAARKIFGYEIDGGIPIDKIGRVFGYSEDATFCTADIIRHNTASEAIEKLKAYEEKQKADDEIKVGDEVDWSGDKFIVTRIFQPYDKAEECDGVDMDGCTYHDVLISGLTKTGRHVDITDMLKGALE